MSVLITVAIKEMLVVQYVPGTCHRYMKRWMWGGEGNHARSLPKCQFSGKGGDGAEKESFSPEVEFLKF